MNFGESNFQNTKQDFVMILSYIYSHIVIVWPDIIADIQIEIRNWFRLLIQSKFCKLRLIWAYNTLKRKHIDLKARTPT